MCFFVAKFSRGVCDGGLCEKMGACDHAHKPTARTSSAATYCYAVRMESYQFPDDFLRITCPCIGKILHHFDDAKEGLRWSITSEKWMMQRWPYCT